MISSDTIIDEEFLKSTNTTNFSRIPVYYGDKSRNLVFGVLLVKSLIGLDVKRNQTLEQLIN